MQLLFAEILHYTFFSIIKIDLHMSVASFSKYPQVLFELKIYKFYLKLKKIINFKNIKKIRIDQLEANLIIKVKFLGFDRDLQSFFFIHFYVINDWSSFYKISARLKKLRWRVSRWVNVSLSRANTGCD